MTTRNLPFAATVANALADDDRRDRVIGLIQSGLIARGHDLGPTGADEVVGPLTEAAWAAATGGSFRGPVGAVSIAAPLRSVAPSLTGSEVADWSEWLAVAAERYGIATPARLAAWLAQLAHESSGFARLEENLSYSAERLMAVWPSRFPTREDAKTYASSPARLAEKVYGGRLGNIQAGDGFRYRGRGLIQLTGRANYAAAGVAVVAPLVELPGMAQQPAVAAKVAGWFWQSHGCNELADENDFVAITRAINGGLNGYADRVRLWRAAKTALGVADG